MCFENLQAFNIGQNVIVSYLRFLQLFATTLRFKLAQVASSQTVDSKLKVSPEPLALTKTKKQNIILEVK